jgi:hypothetical protein
MTDKDRSKWHFRSENDLKADSLYDWGVATIAHHVVLRVGYAKSQAELDKARRHDRSPNQIQVAMSPKAARELADQLHRYATALEATVPPKDQQN